jgi:ubiquinone/menaquinone biosynthesis C-methylase UbiE
VTRAIWHDVECGAYLADLDLWEELAADGGGRVLDVGAGTGRVALHLARAGHEVTALDRDPQLLRVLEQRAAGLPVRTVVGDAAGF